MCSAILGTGFGPSLAVPIGAHCVHHPSCDVSTGRQRNLRWPLDRSVAELAEPTQDRVRPAETALRRRPPAVVDEARSGSATHRTPVWASCHTRSSRRLRHRLNVEPPVASDPALERFGQLVSGLSRGERSLPRMSMRRRCGMGSRRLCSTACLASRSDSSTARPGKGPADMAPA